MTKRPKPNRGSILLAESGKTQEEIASRCNVSRSLISHWLTGLRKPTPAMRKLLELELDVPRKSWDAPAPKTKANGHAIVAKAVNGELVAMAVGYVPSSKEFAELLLRDSWAEIQASANLPARERQAVREKAAAVVEKVGKITGEHSNISERKILRTPAWQRVRVAIDRVLEGHPDLERKLGEELAKLGKESS